MPSSSSAPGRLSLRAPCDPAQSRRGKHRKHPGQDLRLPIAEEQQPGQHTDRQTAHADRDGRTLTTGAAVEKAGALTLRFADKAVDAVVDDSGALARRLGVQSVPALLVLDAQGHLRAASVGYTSEIGMRLRLWWARALGRAPA